MNLRFPGRVVSAGLMSKFCVLYCSYESARQREYCGTNRNAEVDMALDVQYELVGILILAWDAEHSHSHAVARRAATCQSD